MTTSFCRHSVSMTPGIQTTGALGVGPIVDPIG